MRKQKKIKVVFDTNIWISFLIGKRLQFLEHLISEQRIDIILTDQIFFEIKEVTKRPKFQKYFPAEKVEDLIALLKIICINKRITHKNFLLKDEKDNFILDLIEASNAEYLVTGDCELLNLGKFKNTKIITPSDFEKIEWQETD